MEASGSKLRGSRRTTSRRRYPGSLPQSHPTQERYTEIQQALARAGYFRGTADGVWGDDSVKALQEFQSAQGLEPTGKIDSLTLIRLDLGPKYDQPETSQQPTAPPG